MVGLRGFLFWLLVVCEGFGVRVLNFFVLGFVRYLFVLDWSVVFLKDGGLWCRGSVFKFFCGFLMRYDEFVIIILVFCVVGVLFEICDFGLSSILG